MFFCLFQMCFDTLPFVYLFLFLIVEVCHFATVGVDSIINVVQCNSVFNSICYSAVWFFVIGLFLPLVYHYTIGYFAISLIFYYGLFWH